LQPGDVLVSNHPAAGGSHLPDITVITPVFREGFPAPLFWVASRGHHADIGGITPGSMPPNSTSLSQEGAAIVSFTLVRDGRFDEEGITAILTSPAGACIFLSVFVDFIVCIVAAVVVCGMWWW